MEREAPRPAASTALPPCQRMRMLVWGVSWVPPPTIPLVPQTMGRCV